ncbi:major facilitator superfamily domain-containing protein [Aspergillus cavernicola]|uniref:Major facilitator superfamily domain-containing protein n=1 Tax=Aspergillus cavernicola TaxID=176166 RepID=A0ABR4IJL0_9EURO
MEAEKEYQIPDPEKTQGSQLPDRFISPQPTPPNTPITDSTPASVITFDDCPKENPKNWPLQKKVYVVCFTLLSVMNSGVSSSLPSNAVPYILEAFNLEDNGQSSLPTSVFLIGYIVGPLIWSPLSETIGRRPVLLYTFVGFFLFTLATALAPNWSSLLFFRFGCGCMGAAPQTVIGGAYADIFESTPRGRAMAFYMGAASFGPILGPIISGFASEHGWRWSFWVDLIFAGVALIGLVFLPETFGPVILKRRAKELTKLSGKIISAPISKLDTDLTTIFLRPLYMLIFEPIILATSIYVGIVYALVFFYFQAYPIIFPEVYNFSIKMTSLAFLPLGIGACTTGLVAIYWDIKYSTALSSSTTTKTNPKPYYLFKILPLPFSPELHRLPLSCLGSLTIPISLFWLAWTATPTTPWIIPTLSGLLFGFGYQTIFTSLLTYVTDAYKVYSASALASSVIIRSVLGAALPVAAGPMYTALGVGWATSLVGFVSLACVPIPYVLLWWGSWIRGRSRFCRLLEGDGDGEAGLGVQGGRKEEEC